MARVRAPAPGRRRYPRRGVGLVLWLGLLIKGSFKLAARRPWRARGPS